MAKDYYDTLGLKRGASDDEISQAYRELARKHHPDLNPDDEAAKKKFQEVTLAFEVLNDQKKREQYDRFGHAFEQGPSAGPSPGGWPGQGGGAEFDINDLFGGGGRGGNGGGFADLFKQFGGGGARPQAPKPPRGSDIEHTVTVPFTDAVLGGETTLTLMRAGSKQESIHVKIPTGIEEGKKIRLRGQGNPSPRGGEPGDILLTVRIGKHPQYGRIGNNLEVSVPVTLAEAAEGAKIDLPTPHGVITLTLPPGTSSGKRLRVKGHGVRPSSGEPGDLFAEVQLLLPEGMSDPDRDQLVEIVQRYPQTPRANLRW